MCCVSQRVHSCAGEHPDFPAPFASENVLSPLEGLGLRWASNHAGGPEGPASSSGRNCVGLSWGPRGGADRFLESDTALVETFALAPCFRRLPA